MSLLERGISRIPSLPGLNLLSPAAPASLAAEDREGFLRCQNLAFEAAREVAGLVREGWTEGQTAGLLNTYLRDSGVRSFFHEGFAWFGERTRFDGIRNYAQFGPSRRVLRGGEVFILDVAPIFRGYICDIGYTRALGENLQEKAAREFLRTLRTQIPALFTSGVSGAEICKTVDARIVAAGFEPIHHRYPFAVLGHRVHSRVWERGSLGLLGFGWQSYWELLSRGLFGQLLNTNYEGKLDGLWAIEPHIGGPGFGAKFEEILVVEKGTARWLDPQGENV